jgi:glycerophosphoryl diester phosphodiesterase
LFLLGGAAGRAAVTRRIAVIAHRGAHQRNPENTLAAVDEAANLGCDFAELDVRATSDGELVLMHDATVDRCTDGKGKVVEMTFDATRLLDAGQGNKVPSFDEALRLASMRDIGIYIDVKQARPAALVERVRRWKMEDRCVVYGGPPLLQEIAAIEPRLRVMPEAGTASHARTLLETLRPKVLAFDTRDFQDDILAVAQAAHVDIYVDRLGPADNEKFWQDAVDRGATGIQTDRPAELIRYLKDKGLR